MWCARPVCCDQSLFVFAGNRRADFRAVKRKTRREPTVDRFEQVVYKWWKSKSISVVVSVTIIRPCFHRMVWVLVFMNRTRSNLIFFLGLNRFLTLPLTLNLRDAYGRSVCTVVGLEFLELDDTRRDVVLEFRCFVGRIPSLRVFPRKPPTTFGAKTKNDLTK